MNRVYVTGMGIISALGKGVEHNLQALLGGLTGIKKAHHFKSKHSAYRKFGEVDFSNEQLREVLSLDHHPNLSRTDLFALMAAEEALYNAELTATEITSPSTAIISASTLGGMCHTDELYHDATNIDNPPTPYLDTYTCDAHTQYLTEKFGIRGISATINTACSSSANAIMIGARLIRTGRAIRTIVGGVDSLAKFTVNGFNAMGVLTETVCRPFEEDRDGLTLGEGAGYLILESDECVKDKRVYAELSGYGNSNDAFHPSAISDDGVGPTYAMKRALETANLHVDKIDHINAHGTGTENNDRTELCAMENIFESIPPFISTKSYTGHTLGAAGVIEAIFSILSIDYDVYFSPLLKGKPISPSAVFVDKKSSVNQSINHVLSNSFGFAGNCTSLIFSRP